MVRRGLAFLTTLFVLVVASIAWAVAAPSSATAAPPAKAPGGACSVEEWQQDFRACVDRLTDVVGDRAQCLDSDTPTPSAPDSGLAGWFAERPGSSTNSSFPGMYSDYGYAGYSFNTYDLGGGCASNITDADHKVENTIANGEFMIATAVIGASNALRERAWNPASLWGWADPLVDQATKAVYQKVFSVFGVVTLAVVGLYLLWRSRQAEMGAATTTAGWAIFIMVLVTAIAAWPIQSAKIADQTLITSLGVVHDAVGPQPKEQVGACPLGPDACTDDRPPAVRASDTATETLLYRNWLRGVLGSADNDTAKKYGEALYDARSLRWDEVEKLRTNPATRDATLERKKTQWMKVAEQIRTEDPEAYEYLQGSRGMDRVGAGFIAMLAAFMYGLFDITASLLVLLGFLIFRWAVIAAPILGTIGILRPASGGVRRLGNAVVAAAFNIAIFGTGAAIYLFAVDLIMNTGSLAGWLQVVLVGLCGVVGWLLLRPYRRITQLGGKDGAADIASGGSWHRRFFRDMREASRLDAVDGGNIQEPTFGRGSRPFEQRNLRPEARLEDPAHAPATRGDVGDLVPANAPSRPDGKENSAWEDDPPVAPATPRRAGPVRAHTTSDWAEPDVAERPASFSIYRPETRSTTEEPASSPRIRSEAR